MPLIIFPLAMVAMFVASEMIMSSRSRWKELSSRYRETSSPTLFWRRCVYLETEVKAGNTNTVRATAITNCRRTCGCSPRHTWPSTLTDYT